SRPVVGMVHLPPLLGAPGWSGSMGPIQERALSDARALEQAGLDGLLVENFGDGPFHPGPVPPETVAAMGRIVSAVVQSVSIPVGVNVLRNDARAALGVAVATGAHFIRVNVHAGVMFTDQGMLEGRAHETLRLRAHLRSDVAILADAHVKHATPPPGQPIEEAARDLWERSGADGLVISGAGTGRPTDPDRVRAVREAVPDAPLWIGSGLTPDSLPHLHPLCDGMIVGSDLQAGGQAGAGVDPDRASAFMDGLRVLR
ncbi:MAG: BtpA/SgcQ family protein, partial [Gemmatimonadota bacterium]